MSEINFDNFDVVLKECKKLAIVKNKQYGVKNLLVFNGLGILTRMNDKMARLNNLFIKWKEENKECNFLKNDVDESLDDTLLDLVIVNVDESLDDTLLDLINYTIYLYLFKNNILLKERGVINID